jgi:hypothetical protein
MPTKRVGHARFGKNRDKTPSKRPRFGPEWGVFARFASNLEFFLWFFSKVRLNANLGVSCFGLAGATNALQGVSTILSMLQYQCLNPRGIVLEVKALKAFNNGDCRVWLQG